MSFSHTARNGIAVSITRTFYAVSLCALALLPATMALAQDSSAAQEVSVPNTTSYLLLGLAVVALILGIWAARLIARFRTEAAGLGLPLTESHTPIQPLVLGESRRVMAWAARLDACGIYVGAIREPTVPQGQARLRITLSAAHADDDLERLLAGLAECQAAEASAAAEATP